MISRFSQPARKIGKHSKSLAISVWSMHALSSHIFGYRSFLVLKSLEENVVYFQSPSEIKLLTEIDKSKIRVGGMVKKNSISINSLT